MNYTSTIYRIDASDGISYVSPTWLMFAEENDARELSTPDVVGRSIWEFIVGDQVRQIYRELFRSLRTRNQELMLPFRCDSPGLIRHMELVMRSAPGDSIEFEAVLKLALERDAVALFDTNADRSNERVHTCSFCRRFRLDEEWVSAGDAVTRRRWFSGRPVPRLAEALCADCLNNLHHELGVF